jgi:hypothetical protein
MLISMTSAPATGLCYFIAVDDRTTAQMILLSWREMPPCDQ